MISILIPVFNYHIVPLVKELHKQLIDAKIPFELLACDDGSETLISDINKAINVLSFTNFSLSKQNIGREQTRQVLAQKAKYDWLLFLDADTLPVSSHFIKTYLPFSNSAYDAVFGGVLYQDQKPKADFILRWKYGRTRETLNANARNKNPYQAIVSANFIIKKTVFIAINQHITGKDYGYDILFAALLKSNGKKIKHIDNQVYHLGLEKNDSYLSKKEEAASTYLKLLRNGSISAEDNSLLSYFSIVKRYHLNYTLSTFYKFFKSPLRRNLLGDNPNITLLQLYRLSYMCYIDLNTSN